MKEKTRGLINMKKSINEIDRCDCDVIHTEVVESVRAMMPKKELLDALSEMFKVFGDPTRIKILWALSEHDMCVCDIAFLLRMTQSAISHQLRMLKQVNLVRSRKDGKIVYYSLDDEHVRKIFASGITHINEDKIN